MSTENDMPRENRDDIATLLRAAGRRPEVPRERAERVRAAAREVWRTETRGRSKRRRVWIPASAAAAAALLLGVVWLLPSISETGTWTVASLTGSVSLRDGADAASRALNPGDRLRIGSELETPATGRAAIGLPSGRSVRMDHATRLRLAAPNELMLERGAVYVDSGLEHAGGAGLSIHTPLGTVEEIGTQFEVRLGDEAVHVRLREGAVILRRGGRSYEVALGSELSLGEDGSVSTRALAPYAAEWDWVSGLAPMLDLKGRTAREFLDWVAREQGWTLEFRDPRVARSADETVLGGSVRSASPAAALETVLPTCRMTHQVVDGVLTVSAKP